MAAVTGAASADPMVVKKRRQQAVKQSAWIGSVLTMTLAALAMGNDLWEFFGLESQSHSLAYWLTRFGLVLAWLAVLSLLRLQKKHALTWLFSLIVAITAGVYETWEIFWAPTLASRPAAFWVTRLLVLLLWVVLVLVVG